MKTLTLTQPWASLVVGGEKVIETRSWTTKYRGPLLIHAAKSFPAAAQVLCREEPFASALRRIGFDGLALLDPARVLPRGAVIGGVRLRDVVETASVSIDEPERSFGDFSDGRFAWFLDDAYRFAGPIDARGALGLWEYPPVAKTAS